MSARGVFILPDEVLAEIFIRLPVKSIGKSRCVSKQWHSLLSCPLFIKAHLARSQKNILLYNYREIYTFTLHDGVGESIIKRLGKIHPLHGISMLAGPCHGLILIVAGEGESCKLLMNPTTSEHFRLPELPNFASGPAESRIGYGFGYDSSSEDYKVVALSSYQTDNEHCNILADIYSMKLNTWRRTDHYGPFVHPFGEPAHRVGLYGDFGVGEVFVNGALHWRAFKKNINSNFMDKVICALDLGTEKFHEIPYLGSIRRDSILLDKLISTKGYLGIVVVDEVLAKVDIWIMNKYGMAESWTKTKTVFIVRDGSWNAHPLYFRIPSCHRNVLISRQQRLPCEPDVYRWMCYCYNDEKISFFTLIDWRRINFFWSGGFMYSESLVSPHHFNTQQHVEKEKEEGRFQINYSY